MNPGRRFSDRCWLIPYGVAVAEDAFRMSGSESSMPTVKRPQQSSPEFPCFAVTFVPGSKMNIPGKSRTQCERILRAYYRIVVSRSHGEYYSHAHTHQEGVCPGSGLGSNPAPDPAGGNKPGLARHMGERIQRLGAARCPCDCRGGRGRTGRSV